MAEDARSVPLGRADALFSVGYNLGAAWMGLGRKIANARYFQVTDAGWSATAAVQRRSWR